MGLAGAGGGTSPSPVPACHRERFTSSHPPSPPTPLLQTPPKPRRHLPGSLSSRHFKPDINQNVFLPRHALFPKTPPGSSSTPRRPPPAAGRSPGRFAPFLPALRRLKIDRYFYIFSNRYPDQRASSGLRFNSRCLMTRPPAQSPEPQALFNPAGGVTRLPKYSIQM